MSLKKRNMYNVHPQEMFADWENTQRRTLPQLNAFCNAVLASSHSAMVNTAVANREIIPRKILILNTSWVISYLFIVSYNTGYRYIAWDYERLSFRCCQNWEWYQILVPNYNGRYVNFAYWNTVQEFLAFQRFVV